VLKRLLDLGASLLLILLLSPLLLFTWCLVHWKLGHPAWFVQERPGLHGRIFRLYKFRTMREALGPDGKPLPDEARLTAIGKLIRSLSLDELPQLFNVLRGDMSLVGPRPLLVRYLPRYTPEQARRHEVRPGITGWAQVNGRNAVTWEQKFELDVWYVDHRSLGLDLRILWLTVLKVIHRQGVSEQGQATASEFMGSARPSSGRVDP